MWHGSWSLFQSKTRVVWRPRLIFGLIWTFPFSRGRTLIDLLTQSLSLPVCHLQFWRKQFASRSFWNFPL